MPNNNMMPINSSNGNINTTMTMRLPNGKEIAFVDWTAQPAWSTCEYEHGATQREMNLFQYVIGDQVPAAAAAGAAATRRIANERDTNMAAPGSMASTEEMLVYNISPEVFMYTLDTSHDFTDWDLDDGGTFTGMPLVTGVAMGMLQMFLKLQFEISRKIFARAGFGYFNAGFGVNVSGSSAAGNAAGRNYATNGLASNEAIRNFSIPQHIGGQEKFRVQLINANGDALEIGNPENNAQNLGPGAGEIDTEAAVRIIIYLNGLHKRPVS